MEGGMNIEQQVPKESIERGRNVELLLKILRHGDRDPKTNMLTDFGREKTRKNAEVSGIEGSDFNVVKAIGSTVGPYNEKGMGRALETADIYADEIAGDGALNTRASEVLSYDKWVSPVPYDHRAVYDANLPTNFAGLSAEEKAKAALNAQIAVTKHVLTLDTPAAQEYKKEAAGSAAYLITHYQELVHRLKSGSRVLIPAGSHGTVMELLFQEALIRKDGEGNEVRGFKDLDEIGGPHNTSEAFTVDIATDEDGKEKPLHLVFDDPARPQANEMLLDREVVEKLAAHFKKLHPELRALRAHKGETGNA